MKRILLIIKSLGSGGAERQICGLAAMLTKAGYPCRLITFTENQFYESFLRNNGVDYEFVPELDSKMTRAFRVAKYMRRYRPDLVISYLTFVNKSMCLAKLLYKTKLIVSERNNNIGISLLDRYVFNLYRFADAIVPNSHCQGEYIRTNFPFLANKVHPIINFVDVNKFCPSKSPNQNEIPRIVTVARYTRQKNVLTYLKAVHIIKEMGLKVHFDWYGDKTIYPDYLAEVEKACKELCIEDYLTLHDAEAHIEEVYSKADVFCLPSLFEGYPNVLIEAMSCGLPIICSNVCENPVIVEDGVNGFLFDPIEQSEIVMAVNKMLSLPEEERNRMGRRNRQICIERNSEETFLKQYVELIEQL